MSRRSLTTETPFTQTIRTPKRQRGLSMPAVHPTSKRRIVGRPGRGPESIVDQEIIASLEPRKDLPAELIHSVLQMIECALGGRIVAVDPATPQAFSKFVGPGTNDSKRFIPFRHQDHWVLGVLSANEDVLRVFDSQPSRQTRQTIKAMVASSTPSPPLQIAFESPLLQEAEEDSGVLLLVAALYLSLDMPVSQDADAAFWREILRVLVMPLSDNELRVVQTHVLGQPLVLPCSPEKMTIPGCDISIGNFGPTITPAQASDLVDHIRTEAAATHQRIEAAMSSVSSALELFTHLEIRARDRCQQEIGEIGKDVIDCVVRLYKSKITCQSVQESETSGLTVLSSFVQKLAAFHR